MATLSIYTHEELLQSGSGASVTSPGGIFQDLLSVSAPIGISGSDTAGHRLLTSATVNSPSGEATLILYDNATAASGLVLLKLKVIGHQTLRLNRAVMVNNGLFADFSGPAGSSYIVRIANRSQGLVSPA